MVYVDGFHDGVIDSEMMQPVRADPHVCESFEDIDRAVGGIDSNAGRVWIVDLVRSRRCCFLCGFDVCHLAYRCAAVDCASAIRYDTIRYGAK